MPKWNESMEQTYEFYRVNPLTWQDQTPIRNITRCTITRDSTQETLGSASLSCSEDLGECYVRVYLVTRQNRIKERFCLGTFLVQTPEMNFDGKTSDISMDCYTPLLELKDNNPPLGYTALKGTNIMNLAYDLIRENCRAPVVVTEGKIDIELVEDFVADTDDTWLSYLTDLMAQAEFKFGLDEYNRIFFAPIEDMRALQPVTTFSDDNSSILLPSITDKRDLYGIPNALEMFFFMFTNDYYYAYIENDDPNSSISTVNRGRTVLHREARPSFPGNPTEVEFREYAKQTLKNLSTLEHTITFSHGFVPYVQLGNCVRLNYKRAGLENVRARITAQTIRCETGCQVDTTATYTTELWNGDYEPE